MAIEGRGVLDAGCRDFPQSFQVKFWDRTLDGTY